MGNDGIDGPRRPRDVGQSAGFERRGKPNAERIPSEEAPTAVTQIAWDIKKSLEGMELDQERLQEERDSLAGESLREIEKKLLQLPTAGLDNIHEISLALALEYEERVRQGEKTGFDREY